LLIFPSTAPELRKIGASQERKIAHRGEGGTKMTQGIQNQQFTEHSPFASESAPDLERHSRKCSICHHPEREDIEQAFLRWHSPYVILTQFNLFNYASLYKHAHATGLYDLRMRNLRPALENIIESSDQVPPTAAGIVRAIRAYACLTDTGEWVEPVRRFILSRGLDTVVSENRIQESIASAPPALPAPATSTSAAIPVGAEPAAESVLIDNMNIRIGPKSYKTKNGGSF
jgi:hypothetical protein